MTVDVAAQGAALVQAVLLGLGAGALYDLFRILRVRVRLPLLGPALDLLFWLTLTVTLFLWSQWAWGGPVRLYGAAFLFLGGVVYFGLFSRWLLWLGYRLADLAALCWDFGPSVVCTKSHPEKNQKTCKKYLPFRGKMV